jgi:tetratricopeptide (TPR) repeat protein
MTRGRIIIGADLLLGGFMRRLFPLFALLALVAAAPSLAFADAEGDRIACFSLGNENYKDTSKIDPGMAACTRMINGGKFKDKALASLYRARASWKEKKGNLDAALADYNISIRIEPDNVESYDYRADVYQDKGDLDAALENYNQATKIDPTYAAAYFSRGRIYEKKGDLAKAREEYNAAIAVPTVNRIAQWAQDNARARLKALEGATDKKD